MPATTPSAPRRLFFALWPTPREQERIHDSTRALVLESEGRPIPVRNLHITLAFLGRVPEARLSDVLALASRVGACGDIELTFERAEVWKRSGVLVLVPRVVPPSLRDLAEQLRFNLLKEHLEVGHEEYRPHLTLARDVTRAMNRELLEPVRLSAQEFSLVESKTSAAGSIYSNLHNWELIQ